MTEEMRVGIGVDAHAFAEGRRLILGGVEVAHEQGLQGHSDADVVCHAACDAILGAAGLEDIGHLFPPGDPAYEGASSLALLGEAWERVRAGGWELVNLDAVVILEAPRLAPHREAMRTAVAGALGVEPARVTVRATTTDGLGFTGRREGAACHAVALLRRPG
jgi:2-C-methyl-D-erythritol 2,4-cyclodiphosphate synthase